MIMHLSLGADALPIELGSTWSASGTHRPEDGVGDDLERLAVHESGHVVAGIALGLEVVSVGLDPGRTVVREGPEGVAEILWRMAGGAAESLAFGTVNKAGAANDRVCSERAAFELFPDIDTMDTYLADVHAFLPRGAIRSRSLGRGAGCGTRSARG